MRSYHIELAVSPVSDQECENVSRAFKKAWQQAAMIRRLPHGEAWLLSFSHEGNLRTGESPEWFAERLAAAIWHALGRYARLTLDICDDAQTQHFSWKESDYQRISRDFRLSHPVR